MSQRFLPPIAIVIPIFFLYRNAQGWFGITFFDTRFGLVLLYTVFVLPFTIWMMYAYFRQSPIELEEAALVDGCSRWQTLMKVAWPWQCPGSSPPPPLPSSFHSRNSSSRWCLTSQHAVTLPVVIAGMTTSFQGALYGETSALTILSFIPAIILGLLVQRHLVRGLTLGAVEG